MATNLDQVLNVLTAVSVTGSGSTFYEVGQVPAATKWLIHAGSWARVIAGTNPGNITLVDFWWTDSSNVILKSIGGGALPVLWTNANFTFFNTHILKNQEKLRIEITHTGIATVDLRTIIAAIVIT